jgi:hypothetical protein
MKIRQRKFAATLGIAQLLALGEAAAQMVTVDIANQKQSMRF